MPNIGIGIILIGIVIIIASFALPSFAIIYVNNGSSNEPAVSYYGDVPSSQSITSPSYYSSSTTYNLSGQFIIYDPNATGTQSSMVTWYIGSVAGSSQQFNTSFTQQYKVDFTNYNATLNVSLPYIYQKNVNFFVYLVLDVNGVIKYTTDHYYGEFTDSGISFGSNFNLVIMYKNVNSKYVISNTSNASSLLKIPYQTTIKAEYLRPSFGALPSNITTWLEINGKYYSISYDMFHSYTLRPGNNTLVFGYNVSAAPGVHGNLSLTQIVQYIYVAPYNVNIITLMIGIGVTIIGVIVLVVRRI
jgi:hypothetical protein